MTNSTIPERVSRLAGLLAREREVLAQFISELADFDARRCWEPLGYPSLFEFLTRELRLSRGAAFYRSKAVGLVQRFPPVLEALREGKLYINSVAELARVATPENLAEVLPRFFYLSRDDAKLLSVELSPREVVPVREVVRAIAPERSRVAVAPASALSLVANPSVAPPPPPPVHPVNRGAPKALDREGQPPLAPPPPESVEPLTGQSIRIHLTVSRELLVRIEAAQLALSHAHPGATKADLPHPAQGARRRDDEGQPETALPAPQPARSEAGVRGEAHGPLPPEPETSSAFPGHRHPGSSVGDRARGTVF